MKMIKENEDEKGYMFINSLKVMKKQIDEMLSMIEDSNSEQMIRDMIHDAEWAQSHITTSEDDITEVYNFIMGNLNTDDYITKKENEIDSYSPEYSEINEDIFKMKKIMGLITESKLKKKA